MAAVAAPTAVRMGERDDGPLAVSVVHWVGWEETRRCLASVLQAADTDCLLVVVDHESTETSRGRLRRWGETQESLEATAVYDARTAADGGEAETERRLERAGPGPRLVVVTSEENRGFAGGHNLAIAYALRRPQGARWVFHLNDDATIRDGSLGALAARAETEGPVTLLVPGGASPAIHRLPWALRLGAENDRSEPPAADCGPPGWWVSGAALLVSAGLLHSLRDRDGTWWNADLFLYFEDVELSLRVQRLGGRVAAAEELSVRHEPATSTGGRYSLVEYYYSCRNRKHLLRHWSPSWARPAAVAFDLAADGGRMLRNLAAGRPAAARAIWQGALAGLRGETGKAPHHDRLARGGP